MNKNIFAGLAVSAVIALAASASVMANNAALVVDDGGCTLLDGAGNEVAADSDHSNFTSSSKSTFKCYASGVYNPTGKAVRFSSGDEQINCWIPVANAYATRWFETVDSEGNATLTCQLK